jgi:hypothetical protein
MPYIKTMTAPANLPFLKEPGNWKYWFLILKGKGYFPDFIPKCRFH